MWGRVGIYRIKAAARGREWVGGGARAVPEPPPAGNRQATHPHCYAIASTSGAVC